VKWYPRWLFNRNISKTRLWAVLLLVVAAIANILGIFEYYGYRCAHGVLK